MLAGGAFAAADAPGADEEPAAVPFGSLPLLGAPAAVAEAALAGLEAAGTADPPLAVAAAAGFGAALSSAGFGAAVSLGLGGSVRPRLEEPPPLLLLLRAMADPPGW